MTIINRRQFVEVCAGAAGAALLPTLAHAAGSAPSVHFPTDPRQRVSVAAYPFREFIVGWKGWDGKSPSKVPFAQQIELKDFAAHVAEKFNIHKIEPWSEHLLSLEASYLDETRDAASKAGCGFANLAADGDNSLYSPDSGPAPPSAYAAGAPVPPSSPAPKAARPRKSFSWGRRGLTASIMSPWSVF